MVEYTIGAAFKNTEDNNVYDYLTCKNGEPADYAKKLMHDAAAMLAEFSDCFDDYGGLKIAAISDTDGSYAVPMACMGAEATVFGTFKDGKRYALKTAEAAGVHINYELCDILKTDERFSGRFDAVVIIKASIHYFYDIKTFFNVVRSMLKPGGKLICIDFHPFYKDGICFADNNRFGYIQRQLPEACEKRFALTDILQAVSTCGLRITSFDEETVTDGLASRTKVRLTAEKNK